MILKGSQRSGGADLALHLMNAFDNERIDVGPVRGPASPGLLRPRARAACDVPAALRTDRRPESPARAARAATSRPRARPGPQSP